MFLERENPEIDTVTSLFLSSNWQERETYDFFGIIFKDHPQLKRILNMDEMTLFRCEKNSRWKMAEELIKTTVSSEEQLIIANSTENIDIICQTYHYHQN